MFYLIQAYGLVKKKYEGQAESEGLGRVARFDHNPQDCGSEPQIFGAQMRAKSWIWPATN